MQKNPGFTGKESAKMKKKRSWTESPAAHFYIIWIYWGNLDYSVFLYRLAVKFWKVFDGYDKKQGGQIA